MAERQPQEQPEIEAAIRVLRRSSWFAIVALDREKVVELIDGKEFPAITRVIYHDDEVNLDGLEAFLRVASTLMGGMADECLERRAKLAPGLGGPGRKPEPQ